MPNLLHPLIVPAVHLVHKVASNKTPSISILWAHGLSTWIIWKSTRFTFLPSYLRRWLPVSAPSTLPKRDFRWFSVDIVPTPFS